MARSEFAQAERGRLSVQKDELGDGRSGEPVSPSPPEPGDADVRVPRRPTSSRRASYDDDRGRAVSSKDDAVRMHPDAAPQAGM